MLDNYNTRVTKALFKETGREAFLDIIDTKGYNELPEWADQEVEIGGFNCLNCEYREDRADSPTGSWCNKLNFPDAKHGCCDVHELRPDLRASEDSVEEA